MDSRLRCDPPGDIHPLPTRRLSASCTARRPGSPFQSELIEAYRFLGLVTTIIKQAE